MALANTTPTLSPRSRCDYCERFTAHPHVIRIAHSTSVICPRCISKQQQRYEQETGR